MSSEPDHPEGGDFLHRTFAMERQCETTTGRAIRGMPGFTPQTWVELGTCLSLLDRLATCHWGCGGGAHDVEYLILRALNSVRAAIRLMRGGFYDEALSTLRSAGEVVNLLDLFQYDPEVLRRWQNADAEDRWDLASPGKVRKMLEEMGHATSLDREHYSRLSEIAHSTQTTAPQAHNAFEVPMAGGHFQHGGFLVTLTEASHVTALLILPATNLIPMTRQRWVLLHEAAKRLIENTDFIGLDQAAETYTQAQASFKARAMQGLLR